MADRRDPETEGEFAPEPSARWLDRVDALTRVIRRGVAEHSPTFLRHAWIEMGMAVNRSLPKGLLGRSLLIIVLPMVILLGVLTGVFMDRHWALVTSRLSEAVVRDIAALITLAEAPLPADERDMLLASTGSALRIQPTLLASGDLGVSDNDIETNIVHRMLAIGMSNTIRRPFTIVSHSDGDTVEIRVPVKGGTLLASFSRNLAYAANWHFFLVWMVATAAFLIIVSVIFIRNQVKPIQRLADAAAAFGKGQAVADFVPSGAREVRKAAHAFIGMRRRFERQIEQRTAMLAGVSHDLRTLLTRFRLELALQPESEETAAMRADVSEMEAMLQAYLDFARGDPDEDTQCIDLGETVAACARALMEPGMSIETDVPEGSTIEVRPTAFRRMLGNLVGNAVRYGRSRVVVRVERREGWLTVIVEDDGAGVPTGEREAVFRPFYRGDEARNQDIPGTGLGLSIARDVARSHGGDIALETSPLGGLRAVVRLPG